MWRAAVVSVLLVLGVAPVELAAQGDVLRMEIVSPARGQAEAGRPTTLVVRLSSAAVTPLDIMLGVDLPTGWRLVVPPAPLSLQPGAHAVRLLSIVVPADATAGAATVRLEARATGLGAQAIDSVRVQVRERRELGVEVQAAPRFVAVGAPYTVRFAVRNLGNVASQVQLRARSAAGFPAEIKADTGTFLTPGEVRVIPVTVTTPATLATVLRHQLVLTAVVMGDSARPAVAESRVDVVPRGAGSSHSSARWPLSLRLTTQSATEQTAGFELAGQGSITEHGSTRLDLFWSRSTSGTSAFGEREQRRLRLSSERFKLALGDHFFALSPLAQAGAVGTGAGGELQVGPMQVGGFSSEFRPGQAYTRQHAGYVGMSAGRSTRVALNVLSQNGIRSGTLWTLRSELQPLSATRLDLEFGRNLDGLGDGHSVRLSGSGRAFRYELYRLRADTGFLGPDRGRVATQARLALRPYADVRAEVFWSRRRAPHSSISLAPEMGAEETISRLNLAWGDRLGVVYQHRERLTEGGMAQALRWMQSVALQTRTRLGPLYVEPTAEIGAMRDAATDSTLPIQRLTLRSSLRLGGAGSIGATLERHQGGSIYSGMPQKRTVATLSALAHPRADTRLALTVQTSTQGDTDAVPYRSLQASLDHQLAGGHRIAARLWMHERTDLTWGESSRLQLDYVIPLGVPMRAARAGSRVVGRIYVAETGAPAPQVLVRLGNSVVLTDARGQFEIAGIPPGTHHLHLDPASIGTGYVPMLPMPFRIQAAEGRTIRVDVALARGARVKGTVRRYAFNDMGGLGADSTAQLVEVGRMSGWAIELRRGDEVIRQATTQDGAFDFTDVRPGRWTLKVLSAALPPQHSLEQDTLSLDVPSTDTTEILLRVIPRRRTLRMIDKGTLPVAPNDREPHQPSDDTIL
jgi:hypothetical protein